MPFAHRADENGTRAAISEDPRRMRLLLEGMAVPVVLNDNVGSIDAARFATR
jgi:hypothetical protein